MTKLEAAEAEIARLREVVQELEDNRESEIREVQLSDRAEAAETEVARLREALTRITVVQVSTATSIPGTNLPTAYYMSIEQAVEIARAALTKEKP